MTNLLLVPPDTRPPTLDFPLKLAQAAGVEVFTPPREMLNDLNQPGDVEGLQSWLEDHAVWGDTLIVSLETLCLGGLIPARRVPDTLPEVLARLEKLRDLKRRHPDLPILAFGVVVRVAHGDDPLEEKTYYGEYGAALRDYSEAFDRYQRYGTGDDERTLAEAKKAVPAPILDDWLAVRERNHQMHLAALEFVREGIIDHLCLTLDDTSFYGLAAHDRRALEAKTDALSLWSKVDIYPGADEVPATLLARALQAEPAKVYVRYAATLGAAAELIFEDRPVGELVKAHLRAAGCWQVDTLEEADFVLAVNTPGTRQAETQPDYATVDTPARHLPDFVDFVRFCLERKIPVTLADIAYPNGAELRLMRLLDTVPLAQLAGFSAWNTAGNTLGSAIAMGVVAARVEHRAIWTEALFDRLVDDYLYQAEGRQAVWQRLEDPDLFDLGTQEAEAERLIGALLEPRARELWQTHFSGTGLELSWAAPRLAWPRLFTGVFPFRVVKPNQPPDTSRHELLGE